MRIIVDLDLCSGHGRCAATAPTVYSLDESGYCSITETDVAAEDEAAALTGANNCPERAITIVE